MSTQEEQLIVLYESVERLIEKHENTDKEILQNVVRDLKARDNLQKNENHQLIKDIKKIVIEGFKPDLVEAKKEARGILAEAEAEAKSLIKNSLIGVSLVLVLLAAIMFFYVPHAFKNLSLIHI